MISFFIFLMDSFFNLIKENKMMGEYSLKVFISVKGFGISIYFLSSLNIIFDIFFHFPSIKNKKNKTIKKIKNKKRRYSFHYY